MPTAPFEQLFELALRHRHDVGHGRLPFSRVVVASRWLFGTPLKTAALQGTAGSYGNVGYMGLPLAVAFFGPEAAVPAALVFCFDCAAQFIMTAFLATLAHERNEEAHWGEVAVRICSAGLHPSLHHRHGAWRHRLGAAVQAAGRLGTILDMLMRAAGPTALFALGVTVGMRRFAGFGPELTLVAGMKVIVQPAAGAAGRRSRSRHRRRCGCMWR